MNQGPSLFSREFRQTYNRKKYQIYTKPANQSYSHLSYFSVRDVKMGRFGFAVLGGLALVSLYFDPGFFHELFGHTHIPNFNTNDKYLSGRERSLNNKILHRAHDEHSLESFTEQFTSYKD
eukprot:TRINITY_DN1466_c0_g2_i2.p1 TRINITY_DN1466_c0_g2~~TRINITY_DN1466_c0_g2_i2.p1  ORF type:complete len:121 (+),score=21.34 TRINITY_DN1466_c0_g2_i2:124-486(+)